MPPPPTACGAAPGIMDCHCFAMDVYCQSPFDFGFADDDEPAPPASPRSSLDFDRHHLEHLPPPTLGAPALKRSFQHVRHLSSGSLHSETTASSTRSHRRNNVEVSSILFDAGGYPSSPERASEEPALECPKTPVAVTLQPTHQEVISPISSPVGKAKKFASSYHKKAHGSSSKVSGGKKKLDGVDILDSADGTIELIRLLSFGASQPTKPSTSEKLNDKLELLPKMFPSSPPLPSRKGKRFGFGQLMFNRRRAPENPVDVRRTIQTALDGAAEEEEMSMASLSVSTGSSSNDDEEKETSAINNMAPLTSIEFDVTSSMRKIIAPRPSPGHVRSRSTGSECTNDSYISSSSEDEEEGDNVYDEEDGPVHLISW